MAKSRTTWKKGQCPNPGGRPKDDPIIKEIKKLTNNQYIELVNKFTRLTRDELKEVLQDPTMTTMEIWIATIIHRGITAGDPVRMEFFLSRMIGKPKEQVELSGRLSVDPIKSLSDEELEERYKRLTSDIITENSNE